MHLTLYICCIAPPRSGTSILEVLAPRRACMDMNVTQAEQGACQPTDDYQSRRILAVALAGQAGRAGRAAAEIDRPFNDHRFVGHDARRHVGVGQYLVDVERHPTCRAH